MAKRTNNDLLNTIDTTQKIKDWVTRTPLKTGVNSYAWEGQTVPAPLVAPVVSMLNDTNIIWHGNRVGHQYA
jgi:hypothetical protein